MDVTALSSVSPTYKEGAENPRLLLVVLQGGRGGESVPSKNRADFTRRWH